MGSGEGEAVRGGEWGGWGGKRWEVGRVRWGVGNSGEWWGVMGSDGEWWERRSGEKNNGPSLTPRWDSPQKHRVKKPIIEPGKHLCQVVHEEWQDLQEGGGDEGMGGGGRRKGGERGRGGKGMHGEGKNGGGGNMCRLTYAPSTGTCSTALSLTFFKIFLLSSVYITALRRLGFKQWQMLSYSFTIFSCMSSSQFSKMACMA